MSIKQRIVTFLTDKENSSLQFIYAELNDVKQHQIRAIINAEVKKNKTFERVGKGIYKLKGEIVNE